MNQSCLICSNINKLNKLGYPYETFFNQKTYKYVKCHSCRSIYLSSNIDDIEIKKMYDQENYHSFFYKLNNNNHSNLKIIKKITSLNSNFKLKICDFGCGNANFLDSMSNNFQKVGVEYSQKFVNNLKNHYKNIIFLQAEDFFKKKAYKNFFDIIYLGDVLEHLTKPKEIMNELVKFLSPNGFFVIEGPIEENYNLIYYVSKLIGYIKFSIGIKNNFIPYHIFRTNHNSQKLFFNNIKNLNIKSYETYETGWPYKDNGLIRNFISILNSKFFDKNEKRSNRFICILNRTHN